MKLMKKKKGFTIVELVIVIAVIAVLAAVLIPTFINLTSKANKAADDSLVTSLNKALAIEEVDHDVDNMHDAVECLKREGYIASALVTKSDQKLLYSLDDNRFLLEEDKKSDVPDYKYWTIQDSYDATKQQYSIYAADNFSATEVANLKVGFDAGDCETITTIGYIGSSEAQNVVIRTTDGTLVINAENDTVNHYGEGLVLNIQAIAGDSYHEYGSFPKATIAQGRVVVEAKGNIPAFEITAVPDSEHPIKVETSKDVVVSASLAVVAELGSNTLDNVDIKVTNAQAEVVVDEKINTANVDAKGKSASDLVIITKVSDHDELKNAIDSSKKYIMFTQDISYAKTADSSALNILSSMTIDGNGHKLEGYGKRGTTQNYPTIAINQGGTDDIDVVLANLIVKNTKGPGRPVETRGHLKSLKISNCEILAVGTGANQCLTIGGNQSTPAKIDIENSKLSNSQSSGYCIITFNPVLMNISSSTIEGWAALYFKGMDGSAGSFGSVVNVKSSIITSENIYNGNTNNFATIVFEDDNVEVNLDSCTLTAKESAAANQTLINYSCIYRTDISVSSATIIARGQEGRSAYQTEKGYFAHVKDCRVAISGKTSVSYGNLINYYPNNNSLTITGGRYSNCSTELTDFVPSGYQIVNIDTMTKEVKPL